MQRGVAKGVADYARIQDRLSSRPNTCKAKVSSVGSSSSLDLPLALGRLQRQCSRWERYNKAGCPPLGYPEDTPITIKILELIAKSRTRMIVICDDGYWVIGCAPDGWCRCFVTFMAFHARQASREVITRYRHDRSGCAGHALLPTDGAHLDHARLYFDGCEELELKTMDIAGIDKIAENVVNQHWTINK